jgi:hypothetical protein
MMSEVPSNGGNGLLGLYALVVSPTNYTAAAGIAFNPPTNPGTAPIVPLQATTAMVTELNCQFIADQKEFTVYKSTEAALKKLLLETVPNTYINKLKGKSLGFANVTTLQLIEHLVTTYDTITTHNLNKNIAMLHKDWSPSIPIEDLFTQIRVCREFALTNDAILESTTVRAGLMNLEKTGVFTNAIRDWRKLGDAQKTMDTFISHFTTADAERHCLITTKTAGYHH